MAENESAFIRTIRSALSWGDIITPWITMGDNYMMGTDAAEDEKGSKGFEKALKEGMEKLDAETEMIAGLPRTSTPSAESMGLLGKFDPSSRNVPWKNLWG
tara:strand:+ start:299 stop:601 length:303 start_codon:yes stop_codon:yes gene_type:complete